MSIIDEHGIALINGVWMEHSVIRPNEPGFEERIREYKVNAHARHFAATVRASRWPLPLSADAEAKLDEEDMLDFRERCKDFGVQQRDFDLFWEPIYPDDDSDESDSAPENTTQSN